MLDPIIYKIKPNVPNQLYCITIDKTTNVTTIKYAEVVCDVNGDEVTINEVKNRIEVTVRSDGFTSTQFPASFVPINKVGKDKKEDIDIAKLNPDSPPGGCGCVLPSGRCCFINFDLS